jgi:uncharacterized protein (TIGR02246 family)
MQPRSVDQISSSNSVAEVQRVRDNQIQWGKAWQARNLEQIISHYAPDAVLFVPGEGTVQGVAAFRPFIEAALKNKDFSLSWTVDHVEVAKSGDLAYLNGSYVQRNPVSDSRKFVVETGSYVTVLRKIGGRWLGVAEINAPGKCD